MSVVNDNEPPSTAGYTSLKYDIIANGQLLTLIATNTDVANNLPLHFIG